jgi:hypothetical protein
LLVGKAGFVCFSRVTERFIYPGKQLLDAIRVRPTL